jgi:hypothetical protein
VDMETTAHPHAPLLPHTGHSECFAREAVVLPGGWAECHCGMVWETGGADEACPECAAPVGTLCFCSMKAE